MISFHVATLFLTTMCFAAAVQLTRVQLGTHAASQQPAPQACRQDVAGSYTDKHGLPVKVAQFGCRINVTKSFDPKDPEGSINSIPGVLDGVSVQIRDFQELGTIAEIGDIHFADGAIWKKKPCEDISGDYIDDKQRRITVNQEACEVTAESFDFDGNFSHGGKVAGNIVRLQLFGAFGRLTDAADIQFADGRLWKKKACADIGGEYFDKQKNLVNVNQTVCNVHVQLPGQELVSGRVVGNDLVVEGFAAHGKVHEEGVLFSDGFKWVKKKPCTDITGSYTTSSNRVLSVTQNGCDILVLRDAQYGKVAQEGRVVDKSVMVADYKGIGVVKVGGDVDFAAGGVWKKQDCDDFSGRYANQVSGEDVTVHQVVCDVTIDITKDDRKTTHTGRVVGDKVSLPSLRASGSKLEDSNIEMDSGVLWQKQGCAEVAGKYSNERMEEIVITSKGCSVSVALGASTWSGDVDGMLLQIRGFKFPGMLTVEGDIQFVNGKRWKKKVCANFAGRYSDGSYGEVAVDQIGCDVTVEMIWGKFSVTRKGKIEGNALHLEGFKSLGTLSTKGNVEFDDGGAWTK